MSLFGIQYISMIQVLLAKIVDISYQMFEIDYVTDIPNRSNWIHADFQSSDSMQKEDVISFFKNFTDGNMSNLRKNISLIYSSFFTMIKLIAMPLNERKPHFAEIIFNTFTSPESEIEENVSDFILLERNDILFETIEDVLKSHDNIIILYGAYHMKDLSRILIKKEFKLEPAQDFIVFHLDS